MNKNVSSIGEGRLVYAVVNGEDQVILHPATLTKDKDGNPCVALFSGESVLVVDANSVVTVGLK